MGRSENSLSLSRLWRKLPVRLRRSVWRVCGTFTRYHSVVYRGRVLSRGNDRTEAYSMVFPTPPRGKTVLDIGCNAGFYCFMAVSEGAAHCLGIDHDRKHLSRAQRPLKRYNIPNLQFVCADALTWSCEREFDRVLCLNVLQHLGTLERVEVLLSKLVELANEELVLIVPCVSEPEQNYEHQVRDGIPYLLLSGTYLAQLFSGCNVRTTMLPDHLYGPNRLLIRVSKSQCADLAISSSQEVHLP